MVFNKKLSITDQAALLDAQQSLQQMIYDFLSEQSKKLSESEKRRLASQMNMSPISQEYATELRYAVHKILKLCKRISCLCARRPMQNLVNGRIVRLALIQLQFVKKELLVAMQALDQLFSANQVKLSAAEHSF